MEDQQLVRGVVKIIIGVSSVSGIMFVLWMVFFATCVTINADTCGGIASLTGVVITTGITLNMVFWLLLLDLVFCTEWVHEQHQVQEI
jgi:hypothetical protein